MIDISKFTEFDWNEANITKNWVQHQVSTKECEETFSNHPRVIIYDKKHSKTEDRFFMLGITDKGRKLAVVFTVRDSKIRVISARDQNKKTETKMFEQKGE